MDEPEFLLTFPCYTFAANCTEMPESGEVILDDKVEVVVIEAPGGDRRIALFTDVHLAVEYYESCLASTLPDVRRLVIPGPKALRKFLNRAQNYQQAWIDPSPKVALGRIMSIPDILRDIDRHLDEQGNPSGQ